jgi:hypothetical protein
MPLSSPGLSWRPRTLEVAASRIEVAGTSPATTGEIQKSEGIWNDEGFGSARNIVMIAAGIRRWGVHPKMTNGPTAASLTGVWHGLYSYPIPRAPVSFVATLIESASAVSGTTHEPCAFGGSPSEVLYATLLGRRRDGAVAFVKTYDGANPHYRTVAYEGTLSPDGTEIEGRWTVPGNWSGKFLMIRSASKAEARARRVFERA